MSGASASKLVGAFEGLIVDSDVWIDYLRGHPLAVNFVATLPDHVFCSSITVAELHVGVREGHERKALQQLLATLEITPISAEVAAAGGLLRRDWGRSHGVGLNDALIAACALEHRLRLATLNAKHYPMLKKAQLLTPYVKT
jgi:predicted nucleic acid-binding protein